MADRPGASPDVSPGSSGPRAGESGYRTRAPTHAGVIVGVTCLLLFISVSTALPVSASPSRESQQLFHWIPTVETPLGFVNK
jgi:hypothetical protein